MVLPGSEPGCHCEHLDLLQKLNPRFLLQNLNPHLWLPIHRSGSYLATGPSMQQRLDTGPSQPLLASVARGREIVVCGSGRWQWQVPAVTSLDWTEQLSLCPPDLVFKVGLVIIKLLNHPLQPASRSSNLGREECIIILP